MISSVMDWYGVPVINSKKVSKIVFSVRKRTNFLNFFVSQARKW